MNSKTEVNTAKTLAEQLRLARQELCDRKRVLESRRANLAEEIARINSAPLSSDDVKTVLNAYIDQQASLFTTDEIAKRLANPERHSTPGEKRPPLCLADLIAIEDGKQRIFGFENLELFPGIVGERAACYWFGEIIKAKIAAKFGDFFKGYGPGVAIGPPIAERRSRLAEIDIELSGLDAELTQVSEELRSLYAMPAETLAAPVVAITNPNAKNGRVIRLGDIEGLTGKTRYELFRMGDFPPMHEHSETREPLYSYDAGEVQQWLRAKGLTDAANRLRG